MKNFFYSFSQPFLTQQREKNSKKQSTNLSP